MAIVVIAVSAITLALLIKNDAEANPVSGTLAAGESHTVALKKDGTVVATGFNSDGQCNVSKWKDIVAIFAEHNHTIGLKSDGTVVAVGNNEWNQLDVEDWDLF